MRKTTSSFFIYTSLYLSNYGVFRIYVPLGMSGSSPVLCIGGAQSGGNHAKKKTETSLELTICMEKTPLYAWRNLAERDIFTNWSWLNWAAVCHSSPAAVPLVREDLCRPQFWGASWGPGSAFRPYECALSSSSFPPFIFGPTQFGRYCYSPWDVFGPTQLVHSWYKPWE